MRQQSTIDNLPEDILEKLHELLRDRRCTQLEATRKINEILAENGEDERLSKSAVNRYAVRMDKIGAKIRQSREVAQMWIGKLGAEPQGEVGKLLNEMVRNLAFDCTSEMLEGDAPVEPKMLKDLAIAIERLERAASENVRREDEIRKQERQRIKDQLEKEVKNMAKKGGLSDAIANDIRKKILGI